MPDETARNYRILAAVEGIAGGLCATVVFALYGLDTGLMSSAPATLPAALIGTLSLVYFLSVHQFLSRKRLTLSTMVLTGLFTANILLLIIATGGLDSPFYSLWLLAIVAVGTFGRITAIGILGMTLAYFGFAFIGELGKTEKLREHLILLGITLVAGALAEWIHSRSRQAGVAVNKLQQVAGQLTSEQVKADTIISSIGEGVMVVDAARRIQIFNKAAQQLSGWDESSASNLDFTVVLQLKDTQDQPLAGTNDPFDKAWSTHETVVTNNIAMTSRAGRKIQLNLSVSPMFNQAGQPTGAIALFRDISKEKEVERQKDEFVSTASHEMRTPVAAIEGYISLAMNPNVATIDDRAKSYLDKAHDTIKHLGDLFRDLLSVTKAEEGQLTAKIEPVNLDKLLTQATSDMQFTAQTKKLTLVYQVGGQSGKTIAPLFYVAANPERLREVVMNLMENAVKYTPEGGIKVGLEGTDKEVTVSVSDSGVGIAAEDMPHLFQKFYRIDSSATRTIGGTGLGLYLCRRVIEAFNGRIWVESNQGQGSTFKFTLPRLSQTEVDQMMAALQPAPGTANPASATQPSAPVGGVPVAVPAAQPTAPDAPAAPPQPVVPPPLAQPIPTPVPGLRPPVDGIGQRIT